VAPNQRGYSPRARPSEVSDYAIELLVGDALAIADSFGAERFHLVGHDWGGQLAWLIAARHPERIKSLSVLSRPHPAAFSASMLKDSAQAQRSQHHAAFQSPEMARQLLSNDAEQLRALLAANGVEAAVIDMYLSRLRDETALDAALNWYRAGRIAAPTSSGADVPAVSVPTLYIWGDADSTVGRFAAEATERYVDAQNYTFLAIAGAGHFLTDQVGPQVSAALVEHITKHRGVER
jgi:pimeloyl-ACP methyl ester carboxylesterase